MSELDAFEADVRKNMKLLSSDDAKVRQKAAKWLGEAGEPSAITRLRQVYKEDPDRSVRDAAEYSLGMFRALEQALDTDASDAVVDQLQDIAVNKHFGRRSRFRAANLYRLSLGLIVSLVMLLVFTLVIWPRFPQLHSLGAGGAGGGSALANDVRAFVRAIKADATTLRQEYQNVLGGGTVNCEVAFTNPTTFDAARVSGESELVSVVEAANTALTHFNDAKTAFIDACPPNSTALTTSTVTVPLGKLLPILQTEIPALEATLGSDDGEQSVVPTATVPPAATAAPTDIPATPTPDMAAPHITALDGILTRMEGIGGANTLLKQYWADAQTAGATSGCGQARPTIPDDYVLPASELATAPEQLKLAVNLVNTGLALVRSGWDQFTQACSANNLSAVVANGTNIATAASDSFNLARTQLTELQAQ